MELRRLYKKRTMTCSACGEEHYQEYCESCYSPLEDDDIFIVFTVDKYHGVHRAGSHTATLIIGDRWAAAAHVDEDDSDEGGDIAYLQLGCVEQDEKTAKVIADFAKWVRFEWINPDKKTDLPTLVRLIGHEEDINRPAYERFKKFIALRDATKITAEHLAEEFTSRKVQGKQRLKVLPAGTKVKAISGREGWYAESGEYVDQYDFYVVLSQLDEYTVLRQFADPNTGLKEYAVAKRLITVERYMPDAFAQPGYEPPQVVWGQMSYFSTEGLAIRFIELMKKQCSGLMEEQCPGTTDETEDS